MRPTHIDIRLPDWTAELIDRQAAMETAEDRMDLVIALARENVRRRTGGPFAGAVFNMDTGALVTVGVNMVSSLGLSVMHGEVVAIMMAQHAVGSYTLRGTDGTARHELVTSCEPCAMCLGAVLWSGVRRLVCGATREDAQSIGFDEGPVDEHSYDYLTGRGIEVVRGVNREAASEVLKSYAAGAGVIYNG